ncbi:MAG: DUF3593 domain-containing protein [Cyanobacteriota bacterium]
MSLLQGLLDRLGAVDPSPLFAASLIPYLAFLWWAWRSRRFPALSLLGFGFTLVFVAITIVAALLAEARYGEVLANVDGLHGGAESFLTVSNLLVLLGFMGSQTPSVPSSMPSVPSSPSSAPEPAQADPGQGDPGQAVNNS